MCAVLVLVCIGRREGKKDASATAMTLLFEIREKAVHPPALPILEYKYKYATSYKLIYNLQALKSAVPRKAWKDMAEKLYSPSCQIYIHYLFSECLKPSERLRTPYGQKSTTLHVL
jgi:hypothetical protein